MAQKDGSDTVYIMHYNDVTMASQISSLIIVYSTVYSGADQRKHQSSASLASVRSIHRGPVNSPHKWPVTRKMFPFDDVIMVATEQISRTDSVILRHVYRDAYLHVIKFKFKFLY